MFTLQFGKTDKAKNSTFVPPVSGSSAQVLLKDQTSIVRPTFRMHCGSGGMANPDEIFEYNYCYCPNFKRYYFISDITQITAVVFDISCEVDVLATFREDILDTDAFVLYAESMYDGTIADSRLPICSTSDMKVTEYTVAPFNNSPGTFCLTYASAGDGSTGMAQSFALSQSTMAALAQRMFSKSVLDELIKSLGAPLEAMISCTWTPVIPALAQEGSGSIEIAGQTLGSGGYCKKTVTGHQVISPYIKHRGKTVINGAEVETYGDYRNLEPYSYYRIALPGVGLVQVPMERFIGDGLTKPQIDIFYAMSPATGDITYHFNRVASAQQSGQLGASSLVVAGNVGVNIPLGQGSTGFIGGLLRLPSAAINTLVGMTGHPLMAASGIAQGVEAVGSMFSNHTGVSGNLGGWANYQNSYQKMYMSTTNFDISDSPSNIAGTIGRPLYEKHKLSDMSGLVKCKDAFVKTWATNDEHSMIAGLVNIGANEFGGVIIE